MRKLFILLAAVAFAFTFTTPAAAEVNFSGMVSFETYMQSVDNPAPATDADDLVWAISGTGSRFGANFAEGPVSGFIEMRYTAGSHVRHWLGNWNFGAGTLSIGQTYTPEFSCIGSVMRGDGVAGPLDPACSARLPFVQVAFGGLKIAGGQVNIPAVAVVPAPYTDTETSLPKLMASYSLNVGMVGLKVFGGYQTFAYRDPATDQTQDVDSHVYGLTASAGFGPLTVKAMYWGGQNTQEYGIVPTPNFNAFWDGTCVVDTSGAWYGVDVKYKVSDMLAVAAGYQTGEGESDRPGTYENPTTTYFANAEISLAKGVTIWPEYAVVDNDDITVAGVKTEEAKTTWIGVYWRIAF